MTARRRFRISVMRLVGTWSCRAVSRLHWTHRNASFCRVGSNVRLRRYGEDDRIIEVMDDQDFRRRVEPALEELKRSLYAAEGDADFKVEENSGALQIAFEDPPATFGDLAQRSRTPDLDFGFVHQLQARLVGGQAGFRSRENWRGLEGAGVTAYQRTDWRWNGDARVDGGDVRIFVARCKPACATSIGHG